VYTVADRRQEILDAALALADERGLDAVSMRAVASRIGVTPMALYPHVGNKEALLDGLVDRLIGDMVTAGTGYLGTGLAGPAWEGVLRGAAYGARSVARAHPTVVALLFARPAVTDTAVAGVDLIYQALLDAGVPPARVPRLERLFTTFVLGFAISEVSGRFATGSGTGEPRQSRGRRQPDLAPAHATLARHLAAAPDWDAEFQADLADLIVLIRAAATG